LRGARQAEQAVRTDNRALVCFFLIACVPPWIGWSLLRFGFLPADGAWQALYLTGWAASAAGLIATYMEEGAHGVRRLLRESVRFSVPLRWWLFVLFVPILASAGTVLLYIGISGNVVHFEPAFFLRLVAPSMLVTFFLGPFGEEFGWRGYLLPRLARQFSVLPAVLVVGVVWALWHWPLLHQSFIAAPGRELATTMLGVTCMSVLIGTVYLRTGSLLLAMLLHWHINGVRDISGRVFPGLPDGSDLVLWCGVGASALVTALTIPALLVAGRDKLQSPRADANAPGP
jgi:membrane protease YdiL (CAAX protease family)